MICDAGDEGALRISSDFRCERVCKSNALRIMTSQKSSMVRYFRQVCMCAVVEPETKLCFCNLEKIFLPVMLKPYISLSENFLHF